MSKETYLERIDRLSQEMADEIKDLAGEDLYAIIDSQAAEIESLKKMLTKVKTHAFDGIWDEPEEDVWDKF